MCADTKEALKKRLEEFRNQTTAVLEHYRAFGVVKTVQADGSIPKVSRLDAEYRTVSRVLRFALRVAPTPAYPVRPSHRSAAESRCRRLSIHTGCTFCACQRWQIWADVKEALKP